MSTPDLQSLVPLVCRPARCGAAPSVCAIIVVLCGISWVCRHAHADQKPSAVGNLDGLHVTLGTVAAANRAEGDWDAVFGAEMGVFRVAEGSALLAIGATVGAAWFSERPGGRGWLQLEVATRLLGVAVGASAGPSVELSESEHVRLGGQGTLWIFAGVMPFLRAGASQESGTFAELGVRIAFPVLRF